MQLKNASEEKEWIKTARIKLKCNFSPKNSYEP